MAVHQWAVLGSSAAQPVHVLVCPHGTSTGGCNPLSCAIEAMAYQNSVHAAALAFGMTTLADGAYCVAQKETNPAVRYPHLSVYSS